MLPVERKKKPAFEKRPSAVSGMRATIVPKNQNNKAATPSEPTLNHEGEVCRRKEVSQAKVTMVPFFDNRADII